MCYSRDIVWKNVKVLVNVKIQFFDFVYCQISDNRYIILKIWAPQ